MKMVAGVDLTESDDEEGGGKGLHAREFEWFPIIHRIGSDQKRHYGKQVTKPRGAVGGRVRVI